LSSTQYPSSVSWPHILNLYTRNHEIAGLSLADLMVLGYRTNGIVNVYQLVWIQLFIGLFEMPRL